MIVCEGVILSVCVCMRVCVCVCVCVWCGLVISCQISGENMGQERARGAVECPVQTVAQQFT